MIVHACVSGVRVYMRGRHANIVEEQKGMREVKRMTIAHAQHDISALQHILWLCVANGTVSWILLFIRAVLSATTFVLFRAELELFFCVEVTAKPVSFWFVVLFMLQTGYQSR